MRDSRRNIYSAIFLLLFSIYINIESYRLGFGRLRMPGPGFLPFAASAVLGLISLGFLIKTLLKRPVKPVPTDSAIPEEAPINWRNLILTLIAILLYVAIINWLGFLLSTFLIMVFLIWAVGKLRAYASVLAALCIVAASYALFEVALDAGLPRGILEEIFESFR